MSSNKKDKQQIIENYLDKFPNLEKLTLAKKIYKENKLLFKNVDSVRMK